MTWLLEAEGLELHRGNRRVLDLPHLALREGEVLAVLGPNGAGKSSLLLALSLLEPARFSAYRWEGAAVNLPAGGLAVRRQMATVFQAPLPLDLNVFDNVALGPRLRGQPREVYRPVVEELLQRLQVDHLASRPARHLSGGEAQRVNLARALATRPRLLFLDEPFASLDLLTRTALVKDLRSLLSGLGTTAVLVSHDLAEVLPLADRLLVLEGGRQAQAGTPAEVLAQPATPLLQEMVRQASLLG